MEERMRALLAACPHAPDYAWDWAAILRSPAGRMMGKLDDAPQNPVWHGEGSAGAHTRKVCQSLASLPEYRALDEHAQRMLAVAALLHDIGKIPTTKEEGGEWISPNHGAVGARMARELLWKEFGLSGTREAQDFRETVCLLIRHHMLPGHILDQDDAQMRLLKAAADGELAEGFTIERLCLLSEADVLGRVAPDVEELLDRIGLCRQEAEQIGCLRAPGQFADAHTQRAYFQGRSVWREQALYDDAWGEVVLLSGLPGTGKDTWIAQNCAGMPVVSLDALRREMRVSPQDAQGRVAQAALEQARVHLRAKTPFVWNATNLTLATREKLVSLFERYGASARIVYLETAWEENQRRNEERAHAVPGRVLDDMLSKLVPPHRFEARRVDWICI